jgi:integrase
LELIDLATDPEMKFILMAGFFAGMRRGEFPWARPAWFDFERGKIKVPCPDLVTKWKPKSRRKRSTPRVPDLADFIKENFPVWKERAYCLRPKVKAGKAIYRFATRKMFEAFAEKPCPELTPHVVRRTYIARLANNPKISIAQLSEFSSDRIATLERHHIHLDSNAENAA